MVSMAGVDKDHAIAANLLTIAICVVGGILLVVGIAASAGSKEPTKVAHPVEAKWLPRVDLTGTLKPWRDADVGFETGGRLMRVGVSVGDKVQAGAVLAVLDASRAVAQVGQAE